MTAAAVGPVTAGGPFAVPAGAAAALLPALGVLPGITLSDLVDRAALQTRVDRKYLVTVPTVAAMLAELSGTVAALDIGGRRVFGYSSVYFDTDGLLCFRDHRQGRRRRFKVRTRSYVDSGQCLLEIKSVGPRGQTVKERRDHPSRGPATLTNVDRAFVAGVLGGHPAVAHLRPVLATDYHRVTLLDLRAGSRLTIDLGLRFSGPARAASAPGETVVIETKSAGGPGRADLALRRLGAREVSVSKYCVGIAMVHPELAANRWHRVLRRHFDSRARGGTEPAR